MMIPRNIIPKDTCSMTHYLQCCKTVNKVCSCVTEKWYLNVDSCTIASCFLCSRLSEHEHCRGHRITSLWHAFAHQISRDIPTMTPYIDQFSHYYRTLVWNMYHNANSYSHKKEMYGKMTANQLFSSSKHALITFVLFWFSDKRICDQIGS